jgi:hypothetical protein
MHVMSLEQYEKFFESKSIILKPQTSSSRNRPRSNAVRGISGLRDYLARLLNNRPRDGERKRPSYMNRAKENLRDAKMRWAYYCEAQGIKSKKPVGHFADLINLCEAELSVFEKEAIYINQILRDHERKEAKHKISADYDVLANFKNEEWRYLY